MTANATKGTDQTQGKAGADQPERPASPLGAFQHKTFTIVWIAAVVSNVGSWMYSAAAGWLMTGLNPSPVIVAMVQVAANLPMFLFALPAGALADIIDRRRFLIAIEILIASISAVFAFLVWQNAVTPVTLLAFTFLVGVGDALEAPPWQAILPALVPKRDLQSAIVANSVGINISRAIGPALAGIIVATWNIAAPFWLNAFSNFGVIAALIWWRSSQKRSRSLPAEKFINANRDGLRYARNNPAFRATLLRAAGFLIFASAYWALLPLIARNQVRSGPELYGVLLGSIGVGALIGAYFLPRLRSKLGPDWLMASGTLGTALALILFGLAREPATAVAASLVAGISWICILSILNVSAQVSLSEWVRARGLALLVTVIFGTLTLGSLIWGYLAAATDLSFANFVAAAGIVVTLPLARRWKLRTAVGVDLAPSMHWPAPITDHNVDQDQGPVMVVVEYKIDPRNRREFLIALDRLSRERRRDGAYAWGIFEDAAEAGRMVETFLVESWIEHLRQHERVTNADRLVQDTVDRYHIRETPKITHLIAVDPDRVRGGEPSA